MLALQTNTNSLEDNYILLSYTSVAVVVVEVVVAIEKGRLLVIYSTRHDCNSNLMTLVM